MILRLSLLLGGPLLVIFMIFAAGVYTGAASSASVVGFEARWLGMEPGPAEGDEPSGDPTEPVKTEPVKTVPVKIEPVKTELVKTEPVKTEPVKPEPVKTVKPESTLPIARPEPLSTELAERLADTRIIRIKVMVDPALLVTHEGWLDYVDELLRSSSASFEVLFGISLRLQGVVLWEPAGTTSEALLADLAGRDREGADRIVGLAARPMLGDPPPARDDGVVLVFADLEAADRDRFHRPLLRSLAASFGAQPVRDRESPAWRGGSFMSDAPVSADTPPWIDPDNRTRVLQSKWP